MLRIRLSRTGKIRQPSYRVVVAEKEAKRDGRVVERIGHYNPLTNPAQFDIKEDRALYWLSVGAQPSDAVRVLLQKQGTLDRLARFHAGESLDALVTEYQGVAPAPEAKTPAPKASEPMLVERVSDTVGGAVEAVAAPVAVVASQVADVAESAVDEVKEAIDAIIGADEEE
jgi:small subunit ribosomal protein S16